MVTTVSQEIKLKQENMTHLQTKYAANDSKISETFDGLITLLNQRKKTLLELNKTTYDTKIASFKNDILILNECKLNMRNESSSINTQLRNSNNNINCNNNDLFPIASNKKQLYEQLKQAKTKIENHCHQAMARLSNETADIKFINQNKTQLEV